jgi:enediyne biosynthesis protein E4
MHFHLYTFGLLLLLTLFQGCTFQSEEAPVNPLFTRLDVSTTGIDFQNNVTPADEFNIFNYRNFYNGGGVALGDINNNGLIDIYLTSNQGPNRLYLNEGDFQFRDITESAGVGGNGFWTTGVTMADINGNGLLDIYVLNSGLTGDEDRRNELFINQGDLTFIEAAAEYQIDDPGFSIHATFFDFDGDGDLDLYLVNNNFQGTADQMRVLTSQSRDVTSEYGGDKFFRNEDGVFVEVTEEVGIHQSEIGFGLGASVSDLTGNHLPDIYVSNDFWERDYLYINQGDGSFSEEIMSRTDLISHSSMGSDIADITNNGLLDIFVTDMLPVEYSRIKTMTLFEDYSTRDRSFHENFHYQYLQNTLQLNNGSGKFTETGFLSGVAATDWSWGALFFDFNNNGWRDLFVSNGIYRDLTDFDFAEFLQDRENLARIIEERGLFDIHEFIDMLPSNPTPNFGFINQKNSTFADSSFSLGFHEAVFSNGAAYADLNNNGALDLVVNNLNGEVFIYRNNTAEIFDHNYLKVRFEGQPNNRFGIGSHVKIYTSDGLQVAENITSRSFQSSVPPELHFGLGKTSQIDSLIVIWPDHRKQVLENIESNQIVTLQHELADQTLFPHQESLVTPWLTDITDAAIEGNIRHSEYEFNDYNDQVLLPRKLSAEGPSIAAEDVNGNGRTDVFITGSRHDPDKLFIQQEDGSFRSSISPDFISDNWFESTAATFMDVNDNGVPDLIVANGGNQFDEESENLQIRVYENDGNGIFSRSINLQPDIQMNVSVLTVNRPEVIEYQHVFIGGRVISGNYGVSPRSYLLEYRGNGDWFDITPEELQFPGMVTDALWTDYNGDGMKGLIVVGEWMPIQFYSYENGNLNLDYEIENSNGWWTSIDSADVNGDGIQEYILGNWGLNTRLQTSPDKPVTLFVNDYNKDGNTDFVLTYYPKEKEVLYPYHNLSDLITAFPDLHARIENHHEFAEMSYEDLFSPEERRGELSYEAHTFETSLLYRDNGQYTLTSLPLNAQVAPVFSILSEDFDGDGYTDLMLFGNFFNHKSERLAGNHGMILKGNGGFDFEFVPYTETGVHMPGQVRDTKLIMTENNKVILVGRNDEDLKLLQMESIRE